eukprot:CAMPEP_0168444800 /NCGR_PEP_ID=MMETSP0228-20121227/45234_1 /TAXON_ID=133427 /ORGANISM="Protoceratium reticulatum, Strain CCCM 535 (=CCMP 1889)" /LENGTH=56 /DNA_ID=CAMNT_0008459251 /DNA_START=35 /DNA_END=202 /DNA_ORIENTATION=+
MSTAMIVRTHPLAQALAAAGRAYSLETQGKSPAAHGLVPPGPIKFTAMLQWGRSQQ